MSGMSQEQLHAAAVKRVRAKQNFRRTAGAFVIIWLFFIVLWWFGAKEHTVTNFWPIWPIIGMGIGLAFMGWSAYGPGDDVTDAQVEAEMRKMQGGS
ncbi:MAG: 2TM domain-containing protein [Candidatus Nanopelagicales bacterium]